MRRLMKGKRRKSESPSDAESEENGGNARKPDDAEQTKPNDDDDDDDDDDDGGGESAPKSKRRTLRGRDSAKLVIDETVTTKDNDKDTDNNLSELVNHENCDAGKNVDEKRRKKGEQKPTTSQDEIESEEEFEVERIISHRTVKGRHQFLIRWKGYEEDADTWEDENELNCSKLINEFLTDKELGEEKEIVGKSANTHNLKPQHSTQETDKLKKTPKNKQPKVAKRTRKSTKTVKKLNNNQKIEYNGNEDDNEKQKAGTGKKARKSRGARQPSENAKKNIDEDKEGDEEKEFEVEKILDVYFKKNKSREFLIRWKGYSPSDDTWEPEANLNCSELISKFMEKVEKAKTLELRELRSNPSHTKRYTLTMQSRGRRLSRRNAGKERTTYHECDE